MYMDIIKTLGCGKVTMPIQSNQFEESLALRAPAQLSKISYHLLDPLAVIRTMKRDKQVTPPPMSSETSLLYAILCHIDPMVTLLGHDEIKTKVDFLKEQMFKNYGEKAKELGIRGKLVLEDDETILYFLSKLLKKNIIVLRDANANQFHYVGDNDEVLVLRVDENRIYSLESDTKITIKECISMITKGYESLLVKDLKRIAKMIGIQKTSTTTKPELLKSIKAKIDSYI